MHGENVTYDDGWQLTRPYDRSTERPSEVVTHAVALATRRDVLSIEPLYRAIEPDAMDALITGDDPGTSVSFSHAGCRISVDEEAVRVDALGDAVDQ